MTMEAMLIPYIKRDGDLVKHAVFHSEDVTHAFHGDTLDPDDFHTTYSLYRVVGLAQRETRTPLWVICHTRTDNGAQIVYEEAASRQDVREWLQKQGYADWLTRHQGLISTVEEFA